MRVANYDAPCPGIIIENNFLISMLNNKNDIMLEIFIISALLIMLALLGLSIKLLFDKKAEFKCGSCISASAELNEKGITCGCGSHGHKHN